jgi:cyclophilin family peptidyl-prolyl cis-trans isomerase/HEAT repeat protein
MVKRELDALAVILLVGGAVGGCGGSRGERVVVSGDGAAGDPIAVIDRDEDTRRVSEKLIELASHPDAAIRLRAAVALGRIGVADAAEPLAELAGDGDPAVREAALFGIGLLGDDAPEDQVEKLLALVEGEPSEGEALAALDALGRIGDAAIAPRLVALAENRRPSVRAAAIRALGFLGQRGLAVLDDDVARIADRLTDPEEPVRFMSAFALYRVAEPLPGPPEAVQALAKAAAGDESAEVRAYAMRGLARRGGFDRAALEKALGDSDARVPGTAVSVIPLTPEDGRCALAIAALEELAKRVEGEPRLVDGDLSHAVRSALEVSEGCADGSELVADHAQRIANAVATLNPPRTAGAARISCLARLLGGSDELALLACDPERAHAGKRMMIRRIGAGPDTTAEHIDRLVELLAEPDARVATAAIYALGEIPKDGARRPLLAALDDDRLLVVTAVLDTITYNPTTFRAPGDESGPGAALPGVVDGIAKTVERLLPFEHAEAPLVSAAAALGALADPASRPVLDKLAADARPAVRGAVLGAYEAIEGIAPPGVLPPVEPPRPVSTEDRRRWRAASAIARVRTTRGDFRVRLHGDVAPATVGSFVELAGEGYFDDTEIHRVVPNFVVQAGDPSGTGMGDPGYSLRCEVSPLPYERGTVGMALAGKDTGGSQFFVAISRQPHLDGNYTVFGDVIEGMEIVDLIEEGDRIETVSVQVEEAE